MSFLTRRPRPGKREEKYVWTGHARMKMRHYRLTESRVKRIIRHPVRVEEGVFPGAIACMQVAEGTQYSEIWTFYTLGGTSSEGKRIRVISAWRYQGKSPSRNPIPSEILREVRSLL